MKKLSKNKRFWQYFDQKCANPASLARTFQPGQPASQVHQKNSSLAGVQPGSARLARATTQPGRRSGCDRFSKCH